MAAGVDFDDFVVARSTALVKAAWLLTGDWHRAEDLLQVALAKSYLAWHRITAGREEAYVRRVMVTTYATWWRRGIRTRRRAAVSCAAVAVAVAVAVPMLQPGQDRGGGRPAAPLTGAPETTAPTAIPCTGGRCDPGVVRAAIERPLDLPVVGPGDECPVSRTRRFDGGAGFSGPFRALGAGPVSFAGTQDGAITLVPDEGDWFGMKMGWVFGPEYAGPVLLRGGRIDGPGPLGFHRYLGAADYEMGTGSGPHSSELYVRGVLGATSRGAVTSYPAGIYTEEPGCYAVQADGEGFSETIVFQVRIGKSVTAGR